MPSRQFDTYIACERFNKQNSLGTSNWTTKLFKNFNLDTITCYEVWTLFLNWTRARFHMSFSSIDIWGNCFETRIKLSSGKSGSVSDSCEDHESAHIQQIPFLITWEFDNNFYESKCQTIKKFQIRQVRYWILEEFKRCFIRRQVIT